MAWEHDYRYYDEFTDNEFAAKLLAYQNEDALSKNAVRPTVESAPSPLIAALFNFGLLTIEGEQTLFLKMNYAKYMATQLLEDGGPSNYRLVERDHRKFLKIAYDTRNFIADHNLRLVFSIAKRQKVSSSMSLDDFVSNGNLTLLKAIDKFDCKRGSKFKKSYNKFSTYATWAITKNFWNDHNPNRKRELPYSGDDIGDVDVADHRVDHDAYSPDEFVKVEKAMRHLDPRTQFVIKSQYRLGGGEDRTLEETGKELGVTRERVRQIRIAGMNKLKHLLKQRAS